MIAFVQLVTTVLLIFCSINGKMYLAVSFSDRFCPFL